jgi:hypothetical protein
MFRHKNTINQSAENKNIVEDKKIIPAEAPIILETKPTVKNVAPKTDTEMIKELLEKNLKWSQIIYEQNRKINNKLMWSAIGNWFRLLLIVVPLILAIWFLPPVLKDLQNKYGGMLGIKNSTSTSSVNTIEQLLKLIPLDQVKQEQLKALLK